MSGEREAVSIRRILVALDASRASEAALEAAAAIAERMEAELLGLFVEDVNLLRLAALPFARETGFSSARTRPLETADMERRLRAQAAAAERSLAQAAARRQLRWSFRVTRGQVSAELLAAAAQVDMLALATASLELLRGAGLGSTAEAVFSGVSCPLLMLPPNVRVRPPIVAIYDGSPVSDQAMLLAVQLARAEADGLTVLLLADDPVGEQRLRERARQRTDELGVQARFRWVVEPDVAVLARHAREGGTLVLAAESPALRGEAVRKLLDRVDCAVLLVR